LVATNGWSGECFPFWVFPLEGICWKNEAFFSGWLAGLIWGGMGW
jgi:hypothetical protein